MTPHCFASFHLQSSQSSISNHKEDAPWRSSAGNHDGFSPTQIATKTATNGHEKSETRDEFVIAETTVAKTNRVCLPAFLLLLVIGVVGLMFPTIAAAQMVMDNDNEMEAAQQRKDEHLPPYTLVYCGKNVTDPNKPESLPAGDYNSDLHVVGPCVADGKNGGGVYKYHWVFIHQGNASNSVLSGTLTFLDAKLDLYANSILVLNGGTLQAGVPKLTGAIGVKGGLVTIHLWGADSEPAIDCEDADGQADDTCAIDPTIWTSNKIDLTKIYPTSCKKASQLDPPKKLPGGVDDCFYQYDDPSVSRYYFGRKVLAVSYGGTLRLFGKKGSTFDGLTPKPQNTGTSWTRLITNLKATDTKFEVNAAVDWQIGDHIVITPTDYLPGHAEEAIISDVTPDQDTGTTTIEISGIVLDNGAVKNGGVQYPHYGIAYPIPGAIKTKLNLDRTTVETRAAVALLSRSIRIVSEGVTGPVDPVLGADPDFPPDPGNFFGGHVIFRQGFKQVQIQGVEFRQLGQGGLKGRYAVHFHMDRTVPPGTFVKDSSANESMTRWITIHGTQGLLLARNVGWKSIGHGFYIEDGTETDNKLYANIGILARAGVKNSENPREVPGILSHPKINDDRDPYATDWQHPSAFWIMNGWNDFEYNMAAGVGSCGVCYWIPSASNSGPSRYEAWFGYASQQRGLQDLPGLRDYNSGTSPLQTFVGNACSTSMFSYMEIGQLNSGCDGFGPDTTNTVAAIPGRGPDPPAVGPPDQATLDYYPIVSGLRDPTKCNYPTGDCGANTDPVNLKCNGTNDIDEKNCEPTVLDHYTTAYNFAQKNFSAIWLRPWWKLVTDSSITDQLGPGLTFVTGGGYTRSDSSLGNWNVGLRNVYVGQTQPDPVDNKQTFFSSDLGPFTPNGIPQCDNGQIPGGYCLSKNNGISIPLTNFNAGQRMFNIYDGPSFQDSSAYLNIKARVITDCNSDNRDSSSGGTGVCNSSQYMYGHAQGLLQGPIINSKDPNKVRSCYIPNAAIAWKQENGFYYPPAFHSRNLIFNNVDIRHFVIEPLFKLNTFQPDLTEIADRYCTWKDNIFLPFNDIDRQTVLNDNDGSLTGLLAGTTPPRETLSINLDEFFRAPEVTEECSSDKHEGPDQKGPPATAITSPYEYVSTAIIADCALKSVLDKCLKYDNANNCIEWDYLAECGKNPDDGGRNWSWSCTHCYGAPLFRQNWTAQDNTDCGPEMECLKEPLERPGRISMMGQSTGQRSTLTANQGWYYIDTTVPYQQQTGIPLQDGKTTFLSGHTYYVYMVYGAPDTQMTYWMYVGAGVNDDDKHVEKQVGRYRVNVNSQVYGFCPLTGGMITPNCQYDLSKDPDFLTSVNYDPLSGWLKVSANLKPYQAEFTSDQKNFCKPVNYCSWNGSSCGCAPGTTCKDNSVCAWGPSDVDCPTKGCFGFSFKIQPEFDMGTKPGPPAPAAFPDDTYWKVAFKAVGKTISGPECYYGKP